MPCPSGESCAFDGTCTQRNCDIVLCDVGFWCNDGVCYDECEGVICPLGQTCVLGECIDPPPPVLDAGTTSDGGPTAADSGPAIDAGGAADAGAADAGVGPPPPDEGGCGCRTVDRRSNAGALALFFLLGLALVWRRRKART
jgi:MYXO-CTERM domain-containing protein